MYRGDRHRLGLSSSAPDGGAGSPSITLGSLGWPHPVASFKPGIDPGGHRGMFSHATAACQAVPCPSQTFSPGEAPADLSGFGEADLLTIYDLPAFSRTWSGVHTFDLGDGNMKYYASPQMSGEQASNEIPSILAGPLPVDFVWAGDTYADCWRSDRPGAVCRYADLCSAAGLCAGDADCAPAYPHCLGGYCVNLASCPADPAQYPASAGFTTFGLEPHAHAGAATWRPVVGHYQAMNTLEGMDFGWTRCDPSTALPAGFTPCQTFPWLDAGETQLGYAARSYFIDARGEREPMSEAPPPSTEIPCGPAAACPAGYTCDDVPVDAAYGACVPDLRLAEYTYWHAHRPGWMLYREPVDAPASLATLDPRPQAWLSRPMFDIANPEVANEIVGRVEHWLGRGGTGYAPYGALSIDTVFLANYPAARYTCSRAGEGCPPCSDPIHAFAECAANGWRIPRVPVDTSAAACGTDADCTTPPFTACEAGLCARTIELTGDNGYDPSDPLCTTAPNQDGFCDYAWTTMILRWMSRLRDTAHRLGLNPRRQHEPLHGLRADDGAHRLYPAGQPGAPVPVRHRRRHPRRGWVHLRHGPGRPVERHLLCELALQRSAHLRRRPGPARSLVVRRRGRGPAGAAMRAAQGLGKAYFSRSDSPDIPGGAGLSWVLASYLMARGGAAAHASEAVYLASDAADLAFMSPVNPPTSAVYQALSAYGDIGSPCEDQQTLPSYPNVFTRRFSGGWGDRERQRAGQPRVLAPPGHRRGAPAARARRLALVVPGRLPRGPGADERRHPPRGVGDPVRALSAIASSTSSVRRSVSARLPPLSIT